jgi:DNA repair exonuclease SbcCD nuclease subunit
MVEVTTMPDVSVIPGDGYEASERGPAGAGELEERPEPVETGTVGVPSQTEDWESRFKGLQGRLQREIEEKRALQQQLLQMQEQILREKIQDLDPEEQEVALREFRLRQKEQELLQTRWEMEMAARRMAILHLSQQYGVPAEELEQFNDAYSMEAYAKGVAEARKRARREQRKADGADRFEQGSAVSARQPAARNLDEAATSWAEFVRSRLRSK